MLPSDFLARFTTHLKEVLQKALTFAIQQGRFIVEPGDLLVGLLQEKGSIGAEILTKSNVRLAQAEETFRGYPTPNQPGSAIAPDLSSGVKRVLEKAVLTAHIYEHRYVGTEHLLAAMLETDLPDVKTFLESQGMHMDYAREQLAGILKSTSKFPDLSLRIAQEEEPQEDEHTGPVAAPAEINSAPADQRQRPSRERRPKALDVFARDLTAPDYVCTLDPVIGRESETERVIEILCRRLKNNPILLGDPGVGKTAIVEGLAQKLAAGDVPDALQGKRILAVDLALLVAGTMYRGEFEARLKQLVDEARTDQNIILFIDEIHNIVGAGSTSGSLDAANILKPALARGEIRCIGATTWTEYKKHIEPDAALERRYQPVDILEPNTAVALQMLKGIKSRYEEHHGVVFEQATLDSAVHLAERYLTDRFFPDKAIDLLDEAAAHVNTQRKSQESVERMRALDIALSVVREQKEEAVQKGSIGKAAKALQEEQRLTKEKRQIEQAMQHERRAAKLTVKPEHIARVVARMSHVPISMIQASDRERLTGLEKRLSRAIVGQTQAVKAVSETIRRARLGLSDPRRPKCSFLFVGPSGTGKTELARALAQEIFGREDALVKLDMSEFAEGHSVSKLLGSPAGYVGYREGNRLTDAIRKHPHSVLLFDEFEKAHVDVQHLLLQALEDGKISDASGRALSLRHAYLILTSNAGSDFINQSQLGFGQGNHSSAERFQEMMKERLADRFRPELLNRLDKIVVFQPLDRTALKEIVRRELDLVLRRMEEVQHVAYRVSDEVLDWLVERDLKQEEGARAARRIVEREITSLLGRSLVEQPEKKKWLIKVSKKALLIV